MRRGRAGMSRGWVGMVFELDRVFEQDKRVREVVWHVPLVLDLVVDSFSLSIR